MESKSPTPVGIRASVGELAFTRSAGREEDANGLSESCAVMRIPEASLRPPTPVLEPSSSEVARARLRERRRSYGAPLDELAEEDGRVGPTGKVELEPQRSVRPRRVPFDADRGGRAPERPPVPGAGEVGGRGESEPVAGHVVLLEDPLEQFTAPARERGSGVADKGSDEPCLRARDERAGFGQVVVGDGDRIPAGDGSVPGDTEEPIPGNRIEEGEARRPPARKIPVKEVGLVGVDEQRPKGTSQGAKGSLGRLTPREMIEQLPLEPERRREFPESPARIPMLGVGASGRGTQRYLARGNGAQIDVDRTRHVALDERPAHRMRDGSDLSKALRTKEIREPSGDPQLGSNRPGPFDDLAWVAGQLSKAEVEPVPVMMAQD